VSWSIAEKRVFGVVPGATAIAVVRSRVGRLWAVLRSRIRLAIAVVESRAAAAAARFRLRRELRALEHERARQLYALGDAVYHDDRDATARIRARVGELERTMEAMQTELEQIDRDEDERIARARMEGEPTNIVQPEPMPEPVPEPEPVPHEPPGPVIVPEPEPPAPGA
jgi:hypothetical protein